MTLRGIVAFVSPCFLPIVPVFLAYLVGGTPARPGPERAARPDAAPVAATAPDVRLASQVLSRSQRLRFFLQYLGRERLSAADKHQARRILKFFEGRE